MGGDHMITKSYQEAYDLMMEAASPVTSEDCDLMQALGVVLAVFAVLLFRDGLKLLGVLG